MEGEQPPGVADSLADETNSSPGHENDRSSAIEVVPETEVVTSIAMEDPPAKETKENVNDLSSAIEVVIYPVQETEAVTSIAMEDPQSKETKEPSPSMETQLSRKNWYLGGGLSTDAAESVLNASKSSNCFGVYKSTGDSFLLSAKYSIAAEEDASGDLLDHLQIEKRKGEKYKLPGQSDSYKDIVEAVEQFVLTFEPPLLPALQGSTFETQISIAEDPPDYNSASRVFKPDIAPLPDITAVRVDSVKEARTGRISPSNSAPLSGSRANQHSVLNHSSPAYGTSLPQWHRYEHKHRCHPKNVCYGCCYTPRSWNGRRYVADRNWYNCKDSGPLRMLGLLFFWMFCGLCFGCAKCTGFLFNLCLYVCCGFYDSS